MPKELTEKLKANGWQHIDTSGDGGNFGYHAKSEPEFKNFILAISASGGNEINHDFLYPVDDFNDEYTLVCMTMFILPEQVPTTAEPDKLDDFMRDGSLEDAKTIEMFFQSAADAIEFGNFIKAKLPNT